MTEFISHLHKDLRGARGRGAAAEHGNVPIGVHKEYPRMERLPLPAPSPLSCDLGEALERRVSMEFTEAGAPLSFKEFGTILGHALRRRPNSVRRNYPSGGGLYPIETYVLTEHIEDSRGGVFHYHPTAHALERLWDLPPGFALKDLFLQPDMVSPSAVIVSTSVWTRSSAKYGDFTYLLALLEAGHMSENVLLVANAMGLGSRPIAGFKDDLMSDLLDLNKENEQPVHSIIVSKHTHREKREAEEIIVE